MHYCLHLFTKRIPTDEEIETIMKPFYEGAQLDLFNHPISWDWFVVGGRWNNTLTMYDGTKTNCTKVKYVIDSDTVSYAFINLEGNCFSSEVWDGETWIKNYDYYELYQKTLDDSEDYYITVIDYHD